MDSLQYFILAVLGIVALAGVHRRHTRRLIIRDLQDDGKSADEIVKIMKAYKEAE